MPKIDRPFAPQQPGAGVDNYIDGGPTRAGLEEIRARVNLSPYCFSTISQAVAEIYSEPETVVIVETGLLYVYSASSTETINGYSVLGTAGAGRLLSMIGARKIAIIKDVQSSGSYGGSSIVGWQTRALNTLNSNITGVSLASNQITLPSGTYLISGSAPAYMSNRHQIALYNITDSTYDISGTSEYGHHTESAVQSRSFMSDRITITSTKVFELRHYTNTARDTIGLGADTSSGINIVFATLTIEAI
jgi:hypothetical protein